MRKPVVANENNRPFIRVGDIVDYHSIIGEPATQLNMEVTSGPQIMCDHWVVWLKGKSGCVAVEACTPAKG